MRRGDGDILLIRMQEIENMKHTHAERVGSDVMAEQWHMGWKSRISCALQLLATSQPPAQSGRPIDRTHLLSANASSLLMLFGWSGCTYFPMRCCTVSETNSSKLSSGDSHVSGWFSDTGRVQPSQMGTEVPSPPGAAAAAVAGPEGGGVGPGIAPLPPSAAIAR